MKERDNRKTGPEIGPMVYIAGPIRGMSGGNERAFNDAFVRLRAAGFVPINPHRLAFVAFGGALAAKLDEREGHALRVSLLAMGRALVRNAPFIYLLRGWERSDGAKDELALAISAGADVILEGADLSTHYDAWLRLNDADAMPDERW